MPLPLFRFLTAGSRANYLFDVWISYGSPGFQGKAFEIGDLLCEQVISVSYQENKLAAFQCTEMKTFCGINRKYQWFTVGSFSVLF